MTLIEQLRLENCKYVLDNLPNGENIYVMADNEDCTYFYKTSNDFDEPAAIWIDGCWETVDDGYPHNGRLSNHPYLPVSEFQKAILEYRRQHGIFEAGDIAVSVEGEPYLHKVEFGTSKAHCIKIFSHDMAHSYWVHDVNYRHAEPEELEAGKRLEV